MVSIREYYYDGGAERPTTKGRLFIELWILFFQNVICCFGFFLLFCLVLCFSMWVSSIDAK